MTTHHQKTYIHKKTFKLHKLLNPIFQNQIIYLEADINYTRIFLTDGLIIKSAYSICIFETILSQYDFIRIHKKHIINKSKVLAIQENNITLINDIILNTSRRKQYTKKAIQKT